MMFEDVGSAWHCASARRICATSMTAPIASGWSGCRMGFAPTGKRIFRRYLELGGVNALVRDLRERSIRTKATHGGVLFGRGSLFYLLRNRFYIGEVKYKDEVLPGEQSAIMDRQLFDAVQQKLTDQWSH